MSKKTKQQVIVDQANHKRFADIAVFLNPEMKRPAARDKLLDEVISERIKKEDGKK